MKMKEKYPQESPFKGDSGSGRVEKKYFTAEESMAFLEPRIRAMFK